jgi:hypothetical protein
MAEEDPVLLQLEALQHGTNELRVAVDGYATAARRSRLHIRLLALSLVFDISLSVGLGALAIKADNASKKATSVRAQQRSSCTAGNEARSIESQLWNYVLNSPPPANQTPAEAATLKQEVDRFRTFIGDVFQPRVC